MYRLDSPGALCGVVERERGNASLLADALPERSEGEVEGRARSAGPCVPKARENFFGVFAIVSGHGKPRKR